MGEYAHINIEHILLRPYQRTVGRHIPSVVALGRQLQGYEILIVVALVVGTQTDKHCQLVVFKVGVVRHQVVGMHKHLHVLVLAQVEVGVLIDGLRLVLRQVLHRQTKCLLVVLRKLGL